MDELVLLDRSYDPAEGPSLAAYIESMEWLRDVRGTHTPSLAR